AGGSGRRPCRRRTGGERAALSEPTSPDSGGSGMNTQAQDSTQSVARRRAVSTLATRRGFALASLALLGLLASPWAARPARAQSVFEKLLEAARARMSTLVPGIGALPGVGELGVAAPHYVAGVLQQVLQRADPAQVSGPKLLSPVAGTATL